MDDNRTSSEYLHPSITQLLENVTKYVSKPLGLNKINNVNDFKKREVDYASSLPLQVVLYFNVFYAFCWIIGSSFLWPILVSHTTDPSNRVWVILILFAFILMVIFEIIRLYLAYIGNLSERVPELTGFWLLTLIIELPLCIFILVIVWIPIHNSRTSGTTLQIALMLPMQFSLEAIHFLFIFFEVIFGFFALRVLARQQTSRFHYKQFEKAQPNSDVDDLFKYSKLNNNIQMSNISLKSKEKLEDHEKAN